MEKATYTLLMQLKEGKEIEVGALGQISFSKGFYSYTGSAFGHGGIKRIKNHIKIIEGEKDRKKWHIDYLASDNSVSGVKVFLTPEKVECKIAKGIDADNISGFGCSDCNCSSHLHFSPESYLEERIEDAYRRNTESSRNFDTKSFIEKNF